MDETVDISVLTEVAEQRSRDGDSTGLTPHWHIVSGVVTERTVLMLLAELQVGDLLDELTEPSIVLSILLQLSLVRLLMFESMLLLVDTLELL